MKIPYLKVRQKNEVFLITKFKVSELRDKVNFHFRDPYNINADEVHYDDYIKKIEDRGIKIAAEEEGIQRRLEGYRIKQIKKYLEEDINSYFPTSIVLSADVEEDDNILFNYEYIEENEFGELELSDNVKFYVVDGQHRLAGLFIADREITDGFEISAVLLINATSHTAAKIFSDINGNQTKINPSVIYDLYGLINVDNEEDKLVKSLHEICKKLNDDPKSPLFRHIKMLGVGQGAISQAFFIQYLLKALKDIGWKNESKQFIYDNIFLYLKVLQRVFYEFWPVLEPQDYDNIKEFYEHSEEKLKREKSQVIKTNGFGAIMLLFPFVTRLIHSHTYEGYYQVLSKLKNKIDWIEDTVIKQGTGKKVQNEIKEKMVRAIMDSNN